MTLRTLLHNRVTLKKLGRDPRGSVEVTIMYADLPAFVQGQQRAVLDKEGRAVVASAMAFFDLDAPIDFEHEDWRIEWQNRDWEIVAVTVRTDGLTGARHHYKLMLR